MCRTAGILKWAEFQSEKFLKSIPSNRNLSPRFRLGKFQNFEIKHVGNYYRGILEFLRVEDSREFKIFICLKIIQESSEIYDCSHIRIDSSNFEENRFTIPPGGIGKKFAPKFFTD